MLPRYQSFDNEWVTFSFVLFFILLLIGFSELVRKRLDWSPEINRKIIHVFVGTIILFCPFVFTSKIPLQVLAIIFIVVNFVTLITGKLPGIHSIKRKSYGTVFFPISVLILVTFWWDRPASFIIPILLMTYADTLAAVIGERSKTSEIYIGWRDEKTIQGSIVMFLVSTVLVGFGISLITQLVGGIAPELKTIIPLSIFVGAIATTAEGISFKGSDNLTVPISTAVSIDLFLNRAETGEILVFLLWVLLALLLTQGAYQLKSLTSAGAMGAFIMGIFVFGIGGWKFMVPLSTFFVLSSILSKYGKRKKESFKSIAVKGSQRDVTQVFANGGIPLILTILWFYSPSDLLYILFIGSLAAATADTWGTEIGFFSKAAPRSISTFKSVEKGTSGGITFLGTFGSLLGSTILAASAFLFIDDPQILIFVVIAGFIASLVDSLLGATVQASYECSRCHRPTEVQVHCDNQANLISGIKWISNDTVNLICTFTGAGLGWVFVGL